jgi:type IV pilus assembly protein PilW
MKPRRQALGLTLVELLVSISIGLVVVGAMASLYISTARSYRQLEALGQLQSNARYVFEIMGYDIRMAGNWTCHVPSQPAPANFVSNYTTQWWSNTDRPLFGQDETADGNAVGDASFPAEYKSQALRGDTLIALRANADDTTPTAVASYSNPATGLANPLPMRSGSFNVGSLLLLTDCQTTSSLFQMTGNSGGIQHNMPSPGTGPNMSGAKVVPLSASAYYLRNSGRKYGNSSNYIPSLYRQTLTTSSNAPGTTGQELVSGVTDLQILYGVGAPNADGTLVINAYATASNVSDWSRVLSVRVTVTLESQDDSVSDVSRSFTLGNGTVVTDRRLRRSYTMTFGLRKRLS